MRSAPRRRDRSATSPPNCPPTPPIAPRQLGPARGAPRRTRRAHARCRKEERPSPRLVPGPRLRQHVDPLFQVSDFRRGALEPPNRVGSAGAWGVMVDAAILAGPPCPVEAPIESRSRVYSPLPDKRRFVVDPVTNNARATAITCSIDDVAYPIADPRRFVEESRPSVIEGGYVASLIDCGEAEASQG